MASIGRRNGKIHGLKQAQENFSRLAPLMQKRSAEATIASAKSMVFRARKLVRKRHGFLERSIAYGFDKKSGIAFVGVTKGTFVIPSGGGKGVSLNVARKRQLSAKTSKIARPSKYFHLVEFGTSHSRAYPFMMPAGKQERPNFERAMRGAGKFVVTDLSVSRHL